MAVLDNRAILVGQDAFRNRQAVGEGTRLTDARLEGPVEDDDLVAGLGLIKCLRGGGVLVGVDRVLQRGARPCPTLSSFMGGLIIVLVVLMVVATVCATVFLFRLAMRLYGVGTGVF